MTPARKKVPIAMLHGWGVNQAIWRVRPEWFSQLSSRYDVHLLDLPGYGSDVDYNSGYEMTDIVSRLLERAPHQAVWVAWSLGANLAMKSALVDPDRFLGLQLISPTPRFMQGTDWECGMELSAVEDLRTLFEQSYEQGLKRFLMLQTNDRALVRSCFELVTSLPQPRQEVIDQSLNLLQETDLRNEINQLAVPVRILIGKDDRIVPPNASARLFEGLDLNGSAGATVLHLDGGHLCFLEQPVKFVESLDNWIGVLRE